MTNNTVYLDNAATTAMRIEVQEVLEELFGSYWANPSAQYASGREARAKLEEYRSVVANVLGVSSKSISFTSGATESNNLLIKSNARRLKDAGKGNHLITGEAEHPSVYEVFKELEGEGFEVSYISLNSEGTYDLSELRSSLRDDTILASLMAVNNETGAIMPVKEIAEILHEQDIFVHSDYVHALNTEELAFTNTNVDAASMSAHKINGPKGIGLAFQKEDLPLRGLNQGGYQESGRRAGTESLILAGALAKALELLDEERDDYRSRMLELSEHLYSGLDAAGIKYDTNVTADKVNSIHNVWFEGIDSSQALIKLDLAGVEVSAGSACAAGSLEPSRILTAIHGDSPRIKESLRISFGIYTSEEDIERFIEVLKNI